MFHWAEEDGATGAILDRIIATIQTGETGTEELNDLETIEEIYSIITKAHEEGII
jgi:hypothetical protein